MNEIEYLGHKITKSKDGQGWIIIRPNGKVLAPKNPVCKEMQHARLRVESEVQRIEGTKRANKRVRALGERMQEDDVRGVEDDVRGVEDDVRGLEDDVRGVEDDV